MSWETTKDDVANVVLQRMKVCASQEAIDGIHDKLNLFLIEEAALCGVDLEEQTEYSYQEIERQIREGGWL